MRDEIIKLENLKSLKIDEDDILVLQSEHKLSQKSFDVIKDQLTEITKAFGNKIIILDGGLSISSLKKKIDDPEILAKKIYDKLYDDYHNEHSIKACIYGDDPLDLTDIGIDGTVDLIQLVKLILDE